MCSDEERATLTRIKNGFKNANILIFGTHGSTSSLALDNNEKILGTSEGIYGYCGGDKKDLNLNHDAILSIAESCLTGRINGIPTNGKSLNYSGNIDTSLVLSFLQSGSLNYITSTDEARTDILPNETIIEESFLQAVPLGTAIKDLKNRYIMVTESYKVSMPGAPINDNEAIKEAVLFETKNWILFGDPSVVLAKKQYKPKNCIKSISEKQIKNAKEVELQIQFNEKKLNNNSEYIDSFDEKGSNGTGLCAIKIPYIGILKTIDIVTVSGINERYQGQPAFYQDLGDEILLTISKHACTLGKPEEVMILQINIITE